MVGYNSIGLDFNNPAFQMLSKEEEIKLAIALRDHNCKKSRDRLINSHALLVTRITSKYQKSGILMEDLFQEGMAGLIKAVDNFDVDKGFRLSTFAGWKIRGEVGYFVLNKKSSIIFNTTPKSKKLYSNLYRADKKIRNQNPNYSEFEIDMAIAEEFDVDIEKVQEARIRVMGISSLDATVTGDEGATTTWVEMLKDESSTPEETLIEKDKMQNMKRIFNNAVSLAKITDRSLDIFCRRRMNEKIETLEEIAVDYSISRERVRQIEIATIEKLAKQIRILTGVSAEDQVIGKMYKERSPALT